MVGYFLSTAISTIGTILIIRLVSVEEYGLINIAYILPNILISFLNTNITHNLIIEYIFILKSPYTTQ